MSAPVSDSPQLPENQQTERLTTVKSGLMYVWMGLNAQAVSCLSALISSLHRSGSKPAEKPSLTLPLLVLDFSALADLLILLGRYRGRSIPPEFGGDKAI